MAYPQDYAVGKVYFNGGAMVEVTNIRRRTESGLVEVQTIEDGLSGYTPGGGSVDVEISYVTPIGGQEVDVQGICARRESCTLQVGWGAKSYMATGKIISDETSQGVNANAEGTFNWRGPLKAVK